MDGAASGTRRPLPIVAMFAIVSLVVGGCGGGSSSTSTSSDRTAAPAVVRVPSDAATIQEGVDRAQPGDLVLIGRGVYRESVVVSTPRIVVRGLDRNRVVLDGEFTRSDGIRVVADGVAVENLTIRNYLSNGLIFNGTLGADGRADPKRRPIQGWRGSYITAIGNELYGVYAFAAQHGRFDHITATGHGDSGIYVGQCAPCDALVTASVARANSIGYEGTNAGGNVVIVNSDFSGNRVGIAINSSKRERHAPSDGVLLAGNRVTDNDNPVSPVTEGAFGVGIAIGGARHVRITKNRVTGNSGAGIIVTDQEGFPPTDNTVTDNVLADNGIDLAIFRTGGAALPIAGNCFSRNRPARTFPPELERSTRCGSGRAGDPTKATGAPTFGGQPPGVEPRDVPSPPKQTEMPRAASAPAAPAFGLPAAVDVANLPAPR